MLAMYPQFIHLFSEESPVVKTYLEYMSKGKSKTRTKWVKESELSQIERGAKLQDLE